MTTYRMSLVELNNESFQYVSPDQADPSQYKYSNSEEFALAVQEYGKHYYVTCPEEALYYVNTPEVKTRGTTHSIRDKDVIFCDSSLNRNMWYCERVFDCVKENRADTPVDGALPLVKMSSTGALYINPDIHVLSGIVMTPGAHDYPDMPDLKAT